MLQARWPQSLRKNRKLRQEFPAEEKLILWSHSRRFQALHFRRHEWHVCTRDLLTFWPGQMVQCWRLCHRKRWKMGFACVILLKQTIIECLDLQAMACSFSATSPALVLKQWDKTFRVFLSARFSSNSTPTEVSPWGTMGRVIQIHINNCKNKSAMFWNRYSLTMFNIICHSWIMKEISQLDFYGSALLHDSARLRSWCFGKAWRCQAEVCHCIRASKLGLKASQLWLWIHWFIAAPKKIVSSVSRIFKGAIDIYRSYVPKCSKMFQKCSKGSIFLDVWIS